MAQPREPRRDLTPLFADLYEKPSIQRMLDELTDDQFEDFVGYVFEQAGYSVKNTALQRGPGVDLEVYAGPPDARQFRACVQVKHYKSTRVDTGEVRGLRGGLPDAREVTGYLVTTNVFRDPALEEAQRVRRIWPIDGARFLRYINYVRGTRAFVAADPQDELSLLDQALAPISPEAVVLADDVKRRSASTTKVLTLANHKGGWARPRPRSTLPLGLQARITNSVSCW